MNQRWEIVDRIRHHPAVILLAAVVLGIVLDRFFRIEWAYSFGAMAIASVTWFVSYRKRNYGISAIFLLVAFVSASACWHHCRWNWFSVNDLASYCGSESNPVCIRARILQEPRYFAKPEESPFDAFEKNVRTQFRIQPIAIRDYDVWRPVDGRANLVIHQPVEKLSFQSEVVVFGFLVPYQPPSSPGQFDFQRFYRTRKQCCCVHALFQESIVQESAGSDFSSAGILAKIRFNLFQLLKRHVNEDQAGFASAILLGNREQISHERQQKFLTTGTAHLLAISGLHLGILAGFILIAYRFGLMNRRIALLLTIVFVLSYAWLVEFRPPVVRATILLCFFCVGRLCGLQGNEFNLLSAAGIIVLLVNPGDLFELGPQLSFLAFATLVVFKDWIISKPPEDPLDRLIANSRPLPLHWSMVLGRRGLQLVLVSALIWFIGLPLVAANFHLVTPSALIVNPLVILPISLALLSGLGVFAFGFWFPWLADISGLICTRSLGFVDHLITVADGWPWGHWWTAGPPGWIVGGVYLISAFLFLFRLEKREWWLLAVWLVAIFGGWLLPFQIQHASQRNDYSIAELNFIDVKHGSAVLLQMPGDVNVLYDAGCLESAEFATDTISRFLWSENIEHLDACVISHADLDHFNALPELLKRFTFGKIYFSVPMANAESESFAALQARINDMGIPIGWIGDADSVDVAPNCRMEVLSPPDCGTFDNDNSDSIVLKIKVGDRSILLPGDLEGNGLRLLLRSKPCQVDIAMLPHHGSANSEPEEFIAWCQPAICFVNASAKKINREVIDTIQSRSIPVFSTSDYGSLKVVIAESDRQLYHWRLGRWRRVPTAACTLADCGD